MKPKLLTPLQVGPNQTATVQRPGPACGCRDRTHLSPFVGDTLPVLDGSDDGGDGGCSAEMTGEASVRMGSRGHPVPAGPPQTPHHSHWETQLLRFEHQEVSLLQVELQGRRHHVRPGSDREAWLPPLFWNRFRTGKLNDLKLSCLLPQP